MKSVATVILACAFIMTQSSLFAQDEKEEVKPEEKQELKVEEKQEIKSSTSDEEFKTIFGSGKKGFGGYLGLNSHYTQINGQNALLIGGELTAVINHSFNIGLKGYGMVTENKSTQLGEFGEQLYLGLGYGGITLEPVLFYNSAVHVSFPVLIGGGGIVEYQKNDYYDHHHHNNYYGSYDYDYFFVVEPGVNLELNLLEFMRVSTGVSYRVTSDIKLAGLAENNLNGFNFDLSLKFGWF